jgi:hypothetical protein
MAGGPRQQRGTIATVRFGLRCPVTPWHRPGIALCGFVGLSTQAPSDRCFKGLLGSNTCNLA